MSIPELLSHFPEPSAPTQEALEDADNQKANEKTRLVASNTLQSYTSPVDSRIPLRTHRLEPSAPDQKDVEALPEDRHSRSYQSYISPADSEPDAMDLIQELDSTPDHDKQANRTTLVGNALIETVIEDSRSAPNTIEAPAFNPHSPEFLLQPEPRDNQSTCTDCCSVL